MTDNSLQNNTISTLLRLLTSQEGTKERAVKIFQILKQAIGASQMSYYQHFDGKLYLEALLGQDQKNDLILPHYPLKNHNPELLAFIEKMNQQDGINLYRSQEIGNIVTIVMGNELAAVIHFQTTPLINYVLEQSTKSVIALIFFFLDNQKIKEQIKIANRTTLFYLKERTQRFDKNGPFSVYFDHSLEKEKIIPSSQFKTTFQTTISRIEDFYNLIIPKDKNPFMNEIQKIKAEKNQFGTMNLTIIDGLKLERNISVIYEKQNQSNYRWWCIEINSNNQEYPDTSFTINSILENIPDSVICLDQNGNIYYANQNAESMLERKLESMRGSSIQEVLLELNLKKIKDLAYTQQKNKIETIIRTKNYDHIPVVVSAAEILLRGEIQYYLYIRNISVAQKILDTKIEGISTNTTKEKDRDEDGPFPQEILLMEQKLLHSEYIDSNLTQKVIACLKNIEQALPLLAKLQVHLSDMQYNQASQILKDLKNIIRNKT